MPAQSMILDVTQRRTSADGKTYWHPVGVAFAEEGKGIRVHLRSMPLPQFNRDKTDIEVVVFLFPQDKSRKRGSGASRSAQGEPPQDAPQGPEEATGPRQAAPPPFPSGQEDTPF